MDRAPGEVIAIVAAGVLAAFAAAGNYVRWAEPPLARPVALSSVTLEAGNASDAGWQDEVLDERFLDVLRADQVLFREYAPGSGEPVWVFLGYFNRQKEGSQVHSPKHCYPGSGWSILEEGDATPGGTARVASLVVSDGVERRLVYYWFQAPGAVLDGVFNLKVYLTRNAILRRPQEIVFARVSTVIDGSRENAAQRLAAYAVSLEGEIGRLYRNRNEPD